MKRCVPDVQKPLHACPGGRRPDDDCHASQEQRARSNEKVEVMEMINTDYHIHTHYVGCANQTMKIPAILERCRELGRTSIAITDHCDSEVELQKNRLIRQELEYTDPAGLEIFFGCELSALDSDARLALDEEGKNREGFEIVIGAPHSVGPADGASVLQLIERLVELMCKVAANPIVDVLAHPWWLNGREFINQFQGKFTTLEMVPDELTRKLAETCIRHRTAIELNGTGILAAFDGPAGLRDSYPAYVARLVELGCTIALGSDAHDIRDIETVALVQKVLEEIRIPGAQLWRPEIRPVLTGSRLRAKNSQ